MEKRKQKKETSLKTRFLYTCYLTLIIGFWAYFRSRAGGPIKLIPERFLIPNENTDFLRNTFFMIFTLIPTILFLVQSSVVFMFKKKFPIEKIFSHKKFSIFMIIISIFLTPIIRGIGSAGLGIMPLIPFLAIFYWAYIFWIFRELKNNYTLSWSIPVIILAYCLFIYFCNDSVCPKTQPLYESGKCYSCNEIGYFYSKNCSVCPNRVEIDGKCYLK